MLLCLWNPAGKLRTVMSSCSGSVPAVGAVLSEWTRVKRVEATSHAHLKGSLLSAQEQLPCAPTENQKCLNLSQ